MIRFIIKIFKLPFKVFYRFILSLPYFKFIKETAGTQTPISFYVWFTQNVLGINKGPYWPVHPSSQVSGWKNIYAGIETSPGLMPGCYIQGLGKITIGDYTQIAPGVGIISANHDLYDSRQHQKSEINIGKYCWVGMNSVILPGVSLGDFTIVGAGSVVTKSFDEGYCVIGGNPAILIKKLEEKGCVKHTSDYEYFGYIPANKFDEFRSKNLLI